MVIPERGRAELCSWPPSMGRKPGFSDFALRLLKYFSINMHYVLEKKFFLIADLRNDLKEQKLLKETQK